MPTREELKNRYYNAFYEEEYALLSKTAKAFDAEPYIESTYKFSKKSRTVIDGSTTSKLFQESRFSRSIKFSAFTFFCTGVIWGIATAGKNPSGTQYLIAIIFILSAVIILWNVLMKINTSKNLEVSSTGISAKGRSVTWHQIVGTYFCIRRRKNAMRQLVLLLDNGEIWRIDVDHFGSFWKDGASEVSKYIEHFKSQIPGW